MDGEIHLQQYNDETIFTINNINISGRNLVEVLKDDLDERKPYLMQIFQDAVDTQEYGILDYLFEKDINIQPLEEGSQKTILHLLYYADAFDKINLYPRCDTAKNYKDEHGLSLLHMACILGNIQVVDGFLSCGFYANQQFADPQNKCPNFTPLHFAAMNARDSIVELLIQYGANIHSKDGFGREPLHLACGMSRTYCQMMVDSFRVVGEAARAENVDKTALSFCTTRLRSVRNPEMDVLKVLINHGSDVNAIDSSNKTPMFYLFNSDPYSILKHSRIFIFANAVAHDMVKMLRRAQRDKLEFLLKKGADARAVDDVKESPLYLAVNELSYVRCPSVLKMMDFDDRMNTEMVEMLLEAGADPTVETEWDETPLELAVSVLSKDIVDVLLQPDKVEAPKVVVDFYDDLAQKHPKLYPCLEAVDNLLYIFEALISRGLKFDKEDQVEMLTFMATAELNCKDMSPFDENLSFKATNAIAYGTWNDVARICNDVPDEAYDQLTSHINETLYFLELANFYVDPVMRNGIRNTFSEPVKLKPNVLTNCHSEIFDLESISFATGRTLHEYMAMHPSEVEPCIADLSYRAVMLQEDYVTFNRKYYHYGQFVQAHFTKAIIRRHILSRVDSCREVVLKWMRTNVKKIYHYFTESDFTSLGIEMPSVQSLNEI